MTTPVRPTPGIASIYQGGISNVALASNLFGGYVANPYLASDQGLPLSEVLFVDPTGPAALHETATTTPLHPGQAYYYLPNSQLPLWVNAASSGHRYTAVGFSSTYIPPIPPPIFPPAGPTSMTSIIPSYLYTEYNDDPDLQAFVASYNQLSQMFLNTVNQLNLPIYTGAVISGPLLDWVAEGLYGIVRPVLFSGQAIRLGLFDTYQMNELELNAIDTINPDVTATSDDTFKRIITWAFFKGDGKVFNVRWLKRRIMRFLIGTDGTNPHIDQTNQISVSFGANASADIRFIDQITEVTGGAIFDDFEMNTAELNSLDTEITPLTPLPYRKIFQEAVETGVLELPFQYDWTVTL